MSNKHNKLAYSNTLSSPSKLETRAKFFKDDNAKTTINSNNTILSSSSSSSEDNTSSSLPPSALASYVAFDLPVFVHNEDTVYQLMGNKPGISQIVNNLSDLAELYLRPNDPLHHPVYGERKRTNNLVVRVRSIPSTSSSSSSHDTSITPLSNTSSSLSSFQPVSASVIGIVNHTYRYEGLADFQYLGSSIPLNIDGRFVNAFSNSMRKLYNKRAKNNQAVIDNNPLSTTTDNTTTTNDTTETTNDNPPSTEPSETTTATTDPTSLSAILSSSAAIDNPWIEILSRNVNISPLAFSRIDRVQAYNYRGPAISKSALPDNVPEDNENGPTNNQPGRPPPRVEGQRPKAYSVLFAHHKFQDGEPVPSVVGYVPDIPPSTGMKLEDLLIRMRQAFSIRPAWTMLALGMYLNIPQKVFRFQLPAVGYFTRSGPFRNCWIRLGYDPREDPNSRIFQSMDLKIPVAYWEHLPNMREGALSIGPARGHSSRGGSKPDEVTTTTSASTTTSLSNPKKAVKRKRDEDEEEDNDENDDDSEDDEGEEENNDDENDDDIDYSLGSSTDGEINTKLWCGTLIVRRMLVQIIDVEGWQNRTNQDQSLQNLFSNTDGLSSGNGKVNKPSTLFDTETVAIGSGIRIPLTAKYLEQHILPYVPDSATWTDQYGWLARNKLESIRKAITNGMCDYLDNQIGDGKIRARLSEPKKRNRKPIPLLTLEDELEGKLSNNNNPDEDNDGEEEGGEKKRGRTGSRRPRGGKTNNRKNTQKDPEKLSEMEILKLTTDLLSPRDRVSHSLISSSGPQHNHANNEDKEEMDEEEN